VAPTVGVTDALDAHCGDPRRRIATMVDEGSITSPRVVVPELTEVVVVTP
jgi:hypothetical protein